MLMSATTTEETPEPANDPWCMETAPKWADFSFYSAWKNDILPRTSRVCNLNCTALALVQELRKSDIMIWC